MWYYKWWFIFKRHCLYGDTKILLPRVSLHCYWCLPSPPQTHEQWSKKRQEAFGAVKNSTMMVLVRSTVWSPEPILAVWAKTPLKSFAYSKRAAPLSSESSRLGGGCLNSLPFQDSRVRAPPNSPWVGPTNTALFLALLLQTCRYFNERDPQFFFCYVSLPF